MTDLINRADALAAVTLGDTVMAIHRKIAAIPAVTPPPAQVPEGAAQIIEYTNWRGETGRRTIRPISMWWGKTEWHLEEQWMLTAYDCEKGAARDFAWQDMRPVPNPATSASIDTTPDPRAAVIARLVKVLEFIVKENDGYWSVSVAKAALAAAKAVQP